MPPWLGHPRGGNRPQQPGRVRRSSLSQSCLPVGIDETFGALVPSPGHTVSCQPDASDPPVDTVERYMIDLTVEDAAPGCCEAQSGAALNARLAGSFCIIQPEQWTSGVSQGGNAPEAPQVAQERP